MQDRTPPLSGSDRKALNKELGKARAMTTILAAQSTEARKDVERRLQTLTAFTRLSCGI